MSDLMTRGVIMMPLDLAMSSELSRMQFHSRAQEVLQERDTYRDLCMELIRSARARLEAKNLNEHVKAKFELEVVITKAEKLLGEKNGTAN